MLRTTSVELLVENLRIFDKDNTIDEAGDDNKANRAMHQANSQTKLA